MHFGSAHRSPARHGILSWPLGGSIRSFGGPDPATVECSDLSRPTAIFHNFLQHGSQQGLSTAVTLRSDRLSSLPSKPRIADAPLAAAWLGHVYAGTDYVGSWMRFKYRTTEDATNVRGVDLKGGVLGCIGITSTERKATHWLVPCVERWRLVLRRRKRATVRFGRALPQLMCASSGSVECQSPRPDRHIPPHRHNRQLCTRLFRQRGWRRQKPFDTNPPELTLVSLQGES